MKKIIKVCISILLVAITAIQLMPFSIADEAGARSFVAHCYQEILDRNADEDGLSGWTNAVASGQRGAIDIIVEFFNSAEFLSKGYSNEDVIEKIYRAMLYRSPDEDGKNSWLGQLNEGASIRQIISGMGNSSEFHNICNKYGISPTRIKQPQSNEATIQPSLQAVASSNADITKIRAFVTRCYKLILGREPDEGGLSDWTNLLATGQKTAAEIIDGFYGSQEFQSFRYNYEKQVEILYNTMLDRQSDPEGKKYWVSLMYSGYNYRHIINGFCGSIEFGNLCNTYGITPGSVNAGNAPSITTVADIPKIRAFVERCYNIILGRESDPMGLDDWTSVLASGRGTASEIVYGFVASEEFNNKNHSYEESVEILYNTMLDRGSDPGGKANWVQVLKDGNSIAAVINGFCGSIEFGRLCAEYGIKPGSVPNVAVMSGWKQINGNSYYYVNGKKLTGLQRVESGWYYFGDDGAMRTGWQEIEGTRRFFKPDGKMVTDWYKVGNNWVLFNEKGVMIKEGPLYGANTGVCLTDQKEVNDEFVAWLRIPGTTVNHPVVLSDNVSYYMDHTFTGQKSKDGTLISLGKCNWRAPSKNIVIYGHHVEGSGDRMFKALLKYKNAGYYSQHPTFYLDSMYSSGTYRIFAVFDMIEGTIDPSRTSFGSNEEFMDFVSYAKSISYYTTGVPVDKDDTIVTFVTCDRYFKPKVGRLIVMAKRD